MDSLAPIPLPEWRPATPAERVWLKLAMAGWVGELCKIERGEVVRYTIERVETKEDTEE